MNTKVINIARDYSVTPYGRYRGDGEHSGERFREEVLVPALRMNDKVIVELDGVRGYGSSFLDEAFGGLVRKEHFTESELVAKLELVTKYTSYKEEVFSYIKEAKPESR